LPFEFKKLYDSNIYNYLLGLKDSLIENIFKPFLQRYPCKQTILSKNKDYIVLPIGYNLYSKTSKRNNGHELLMIIDLSKLYEYSHNIHLVSLRFNEIILFVDNLFSDRGIVNHETWISTNLSSFLQTVETWKNPPEPQKPPSKLPTWAPKGKTNQQYELELKQWKKRKKLLLSDTYYISFDCLISKQVPHSLASLDIVGALKKKKQTKRKRKIKKHKKNTKKKKFSKN
tara:strand:+ start:1093 stop:1779 length:687 start_codon:yes stop_codon:yes gene_type:complete